MATVIDHEVQAYIATYRLPITGVRISWKGNHKYGFTYSYNFHFWATVVVYVLLPIVRLQVF